MSPLSVALLTICLLASCRPRQHSAPATVLWCPSSADSVAGTWVATSSRSTTLPGIHLNPLGIHLLGDGTVAVSHGRPEPTPYRWQYSPSSCELALTVTQVHSTEARAYRADEVLGRIQRFDSSAQRVVLVLERGPRRFFCDGLQFRREYPGCRWREAAGA